MPIFMLFLMVSSSVFAAEVATLETNRYNKNEVTLILTDDSLYPLLEKTFAAKPCTPRIGNNNLVAVREHNASHACRAEYVKFLLNNGYKSIDFITFSKP